MNENISNCIKKTEKGVVLAVRLTPNSSRDEISGYTDEYVKIKISAPPNENKANKKLLEFISKYFDIPKTDTILVSGDKSRLKKILLKNIDEEFIKQKFFVRDKINL